MELLTLALIGVALVVGFIGGIAWTRRQLKKDPAKLDTLVAQAKDYRDRLRRKGA